MIENNFFHLQVDIRVSVQLWSKSKFAFVLHDLPNNIANFPLINIPGINSVGNRFVARLSLFCYF